MRRGDKQGLLALSAEDIEWIIPGGCGPLSRLGRQSFHDGHRSRYRRGHVAGLTPTPSRGWPSSPASRGTAIARSLERRRCSFPGLPSSAFVAKSFTGAKFVKGFNHLPAATLATDPIVEGGHRVVFLSSDDDDAIGPVADWPNNSSSHPSSWESSTRVALWCTHAAALGVSSSSRIC